MENRPKDSSKPLRSSSNKARDLYETYLKGTRKRSIPISDSEEEKHKEEEKEMKDQPEKIEADEKEIIDKNENKEESKIQEMNDILTDELEQQTKLVNEAQNKLNEIKKENEELRDQIKRKAAELENFRQRTMREKNEMVDYANERLLFKMLDPLDDMTAAIESGKKSDDKDALIKGVEMIRQKMIKIFEESGVKKMEDPTGEPFDVDYQEAMMTQPSDMPEGHVVQVVQPGYMIHDKVLRYARVITSSGAPKSE
ncbi:MAG: nucleotide exchange factor GrpE [Candidatus Kapaibacterium sp.]